MEKVINILNSVKEGIDYAKEEELVTSGLLDSFDIVTLVAKLNDEFDIEISVSDIVPENFESAESIYNMVKRLEEE